MNKNEFLTKLDQALVGVPEGERKEILYDYEEHFRNAGAAGKTEAEISHSLGTPEFIAEQYLAGDSGTPAKTRHFIFHMIGAMESKVSRGVISFRERINRNGLIFGLGTVLLLSIIALEVITLSHQTQILRHQRSEQQQNILPVIREYQRQAKFNPELFAGLLKIAEKAKYNQTAIRKAAEIIAKVQFNPLPVLKIAGLAGNADHEVRHLDDLMEVTITYGDGSFKESLKMVELAKHAVNGAISPAELEAKVKYYRAHSRAKTIEEAERMMEQAFENP